VRDLDEARLSRWLGGMFPGFSRIDRIEKFAGGQSNPTYLLESGSERYVLRRKPFGELLPSAHAIDREFRLLTALTPTGFPVPCPIALCTDASVIGSMFYLMGMVDGRTWRDGTLPDVEADTRRSIYGSLVDTIAALHSIDHLGLGLGDFGAHGNYVARQVRRWTQQYRAAQTDEIPEVEKLIDWLPSTMPEQTRTAIVHGDFRIDNVVFDYERAQVRAVLDWELATIGDPLADFANFAMCWIIPRDGRSGLGGVDLEKAGIPTLDDVIARYCAATGCDGIADLHWYFSYTLFRLVGIIQGIRKRIRDGNASSEAAVEAVAMIEPLARLSWEQARLAGASG
jgi:aminoglycoside phosphotransferase (APT) family kinase protein